MTFNVRQINRPEKDGVMKIVLHAGVKCTDEERLLTTLRSNKDILAQRRVAVPDPRNYRVILRETLNKMRHQDPSEEARDILLDVFLEGEADDIETVFLSNAFFFGIPREAIANDQFYPKAVTSLAKFLHLFQEDDVLLTFALRNPASFVPNLFHASNVTEFGGILNNSNPLSLKWSELVLRLRNAFPDLPMFLWCNEDTPFIWGQIIRTLTNLPYPQKIRGDFDLYQDILPADAFARFQQYLETHPSMNVGQLKKVMFAFAERFALPDVMDEVIDAPNWTDTLIEKLTIIYDKDIEAIARIPKTQLLLP